MSLWVFKMYLCPLLCCHRRCRSSLASISAVQSWEEYSNSIQSKTWSSKGDEFVVMVFPSPHMGETQILTHFSVVGSFSLKDTLIFGEI